MKQVTVKRIVELTGNPYFKVQVDGETHSVFMYKPDAHEDDIYNEDKNKASAMALAKQLEEGKAPTEEVIYQTPTN